jgi:hypothetical protein
MNINQEELMYLLKRANKEGARGNRVIEAILPNSATSNITDTILITDRPIPSASEASWYA